MKIISLSVVIFFATHAFTQIKGVEKYKRWDDSLNWSTNQKIWIYDDDARATKSYYFMNHSFEESYNLVLAELKLLLKTNGLKINDNDDAWTDEGENEYSPDQFRKFFKDVYLNKRDLYWEWKVKDKNEEVAYPWRIRFFINYEIVAIYIYNTFESTFSELNTAAQ